MVFHLDDCIISYPFSYWWMYSFFHFGDIMNSDVNILVLASCTHISVHFMHKNGRFGSLESTKLWHFLRTVVSSLWPTMCESFRCTLSLAGFCVCHTLRFQTFCWCVIVSCNFVLHFSDYEWYWTHFVYLWPFGYFLWVLFESLEHFCIVFLNHL